MSPADPLRGPAKKGGCAAVVLAALAKGVGTPASGVLRIALRATAPWAALDPGTRGAGRVGKPEPACARRRRIMQAVWKVYRVVRNNGDGMTGMSRGRPPHG